MLNPFSVMSDKARGVARLMCWRFLTPELSLSSGSTQVLSDSDWSVANEIFVRREYDDAILKAFLPDNGRAPVRILDLGANVGFFSMRCVDLHAETSSARPLQLMAVEGSRKVFQELRRRISLLPAHNIDFILRNGLVGQRSGKAMFHSSLVSSCTNSVNRDGRVSRNPVRSSYAEETPYIDLEEMIPADAAIDLIKCDIEGSELVFLQNYPLLLQQTRHIVIELHPLQCDAGSCRDLLAAAGFVRDRVMFAHPTHSLEIYSKK